MIVDKELKNLGIDSEYTDAVKECMEENNFKIEDFKGKAERGNYGQRILLGNEIWLFMTDKEADLSCKELVIALINDKGVQSLEGWRSYANEKEVKKLFESFFIGSLYGYTEDIANEGSDRYPNRLLEEMVRDGIIKEETAMDPDYGYSGDIDNFVSSMVEDRMSLDNCGLEAFKREFGYQEVIKVLENNNLIDIDAYAEHIIEIDGRGNTLAFYDSEEHKHKNIYYYREN